VVQNGRDILNFTNDLVLHFRNILLAVSVGEDSEALDYSKDYVEKLREQGGRVSYEYILELINDFSELCNRIKYSSNPRVLLEVACIKACTPVTEEGNGALAKRLANLERMLADGSFSVPARNTSVQATQPAPAEKPKPVIEKAVPEDVKNVIAKWHSFVKGYNGLLMKGVLKESVEAAYLSEDMPALVCDNKMAAARCEMERRILARR
jgi:DNA polymerase-3 subunit gamma/tau